MFRLVHPHMFSFETRTRHVRIYMCQVVEEELGSMCTFLPKFHAPCNAIEFVWGNGKKRNRQVCDFQMATLRR